MKNKRFKADIILVTIIILIALLMAFFMSIFSHKGNDIEITVGGKIYKTVSLNANREVNINDTNVLVINKGKAYMKTATCKDKICVNHKKISETGETIVCLPNKVVVTVINASKEHLDYEVW